MDWQMTTVAGCAFHVSTWYIHPKCDWEPDRSKIFFLLNWLYFSSHFLDTTNQSWYLKFFNLQKSSKDSTIISESPRFTNILLYLRSLFLCLLELFGHKTLLLLWMFWHIFSKKSDTIWYYCNNIIRLSKFNILV